MLAGSGLAGRRWRRLAAGWNGAHELAVAIAGEVEHPTDRTRAARCRRTNSPQRIRAGLEVWCRNHPEAVGSEPAIERYDEELVPAVVNGGEQPSGGIARNRLHYDE